MLRLPPNIALKAVLGASDCTTVGCKSYIGAPTPGAGVGVESHGRGGKTASL